VQTLQRNYLGVAQVELAIVGDFDPPACLAVLKETLADWKPKQSYERIAMPINAMPKPTELEINTPDKPTPCTRRACCSLSRITTLITRR